MSTGQPADSKVVTVRPGTLTKFRGYVLDVMLITFIACMATVIGRIGPLRRRIIPKMLEHFEKQNVISSYNEVALWENALDKPLTFAAGIWPMLRLMRQALTVTIGDIARNVRLINVSDGSETSLYDYQGQGRFMVLNFGSQS